MNTTKIYFATIKEFSSNTVLQQMMHNKVIASYNSNRNGYLLTANNAVEQSADVREYIKELLDKESLAYDSFTFESDIKQQSNQGNWFTDMPAHTFDISVNARSVTYDCLLIIDENTFIVASPINNEIFKFTKGRQDKAFFVRD